MNSYSIEVIHRKAFGKLLTPHYEAALILPYMEVPGSGRVIPRYAKDSNTLQTGECLDPSLIADTPQEVAIAGRSASAQAWGTH